MGSIGRSAKTLLRSRRFNETVRAIARGRCRPLGGSRTAARHGLRAPSEHGTQPNRRPSLHQRGVAARAGLERTLYAVDELSSFVIAVALVRPTKSIHNVDVRAVKKKMKDKAFARAVNRDDIIRGAEELGMPLDDVIAQVIAALKHDADRLGLTGTAVARPAL